MSDDKKLTLKSVVIFCILAGVPVYILMALLNAFLGGPAYDGENALHPAVGLSGLLVMCFPAAANFITRLVTGEGLKESYLSISMRNGKWKYYVIALLVPMLIFGGVGCAIIVLFYFRDIPPGEVIDAAKVETGVYLVLTQAGMTLAVLLPYFGEEFGWRAYLTPKLTKLMGEPCAVIVSGIIWGLWHAPLTVSGHNFGLDYPGFPFVGILIMCILCTAESAFLTLITKRTDSVIPAAVAHAINNNASAGVFLTVIINQGMADKMSDINMPLFFFVMLLPVSVTGIVSYVILLRDSRRVKVSC